MKKSEIKVGGMYTAKVNGKMVTVRVDAIRVVMGTSRDETRYDITNLATGRQTTFRSAAKFRSVAKQPTAVGRGVQSPTPTGLIVPTVGRHGEEADPCQPEDDDGSSPITSVAAHRHLMNSAGECVRCGFTEAEVLSQCDGTAACLATTNEPGEQCGVCGGIVPFVGGASEPPLPSTALTGSPTSVSATSVATGIAPHKPLQRRPPSGGGGNGRLPTGRRARTGAYHAEG